MRIDYTLLKHISLDPKNKTKDAFDDSIALSSCLKLFSNIIFEFQSLKLNEIALFVNSMNHWITNKTYLTNTKYKPGTVIEYECGLNYQGELSYRHTGLVIEEFDKKIVVIPSSSTKSLIDKSSKKENGLWYYVLVGKKEGFDHDCVLILNDMKTISKKRVIASFNNITKGKDGLKIFDTIKLEILRHYFPKQILEKENIIKDLSDQNNKIKNLNEQLQKDVYEKSEKIKKLYWILNNKTDYYKKHKKSN